MVNSKRVCNECGLNKDISDFRCRLVNNKKYFERICKSCSYKRGSENRKTESFKRKQRERYNKNKDDINARRRDKYVPHPRIRTKQSKEDRFLKVKEWTKNNPDKRKMYVKKYHETHLVEESNYRKQNREEINDRVKKYRLKNKDKINSALREWRKNAAVKLRHRVSCLIRLYIEGIKRGSILKYLPYTIYDLKKHLELLFEPWMSWENWGVYDSKIWDDNNSLTWTWQLDHIIPQSDLPYFSMEDENFKKCWALKNLRPYSAKQNILDGSRRVRHREVR